MSIYLQATAKLDLWSKQRSKNWYQSRFDLASILGNLLQKDNKQLVVRIPVQVGRVFQWEGSHFWGDDWNRWWRWVISGERGILSLERRLGCQWRDYRCEGLKRSYD